VFEVRIIMRCRHLVDPEILPTLEVLPPLNLSLQSLEAVRTSYAEWAEKYWSTIPLDMTGLKLTEHKIPGAPGDPMVRVLVIEPTALDGPRPGIIDIHGGGRVIATADGDVRPCISLARELNAAVVMMDYRLAPETVFPGSLEDCYAALKWFFEMAETYDIDCDRIAVLGISAGGTLAAGVALLARDRKQFPISHLHLIHPVLDDCTCVQADPSPIGEYGWTRKENTFGWSALLGMAPGGEGVSPYAAPGRMEDLGGLPSTFTSCRTLDLFVEENLEFSRRLVRVSVDSTFIPALAA
jgi:triacylglycerol lipase